MGSVWLARHVYLDAPVAVKLMAPTFRRSPRARSRFLREAKAAAKLRSRNVVSVLDYGIDRGTPYIVMERLDGEDLWTRLARQRTLPITDVARLLRSIGSALSLAHLAGIVHRDLKPENIFLARAAGEPGEVVKVLDFGIAKELDRSPGDETTTGVILGTPHYMSPEQATGAPFVDHRSDLWSVGIILYSALTGRLPFESVAPVDILDAIVSEPIPQPSRIAPQLPASADPFFERALARDPSARFQTVEELVEAFERLVVRDAPGPEHGTSGFDELEIKSGDFVAVTARQLDVWACGISASAPSPPALNAEPIAALLVSRNDLAREPEGWLQGVRYRLSRAWSCVGAMLFVRRRRSRQS
jgi:serine/threonine-protein kinase